MDLRRSADFHVFRLVTGFQLHRTFDEGTFNGGGQHRIGHVRLAVKPAVDVALAVQQCDRQFHAPEHVDSGGCALELDGGNGVDAAAHRHCGFVVEYAFRGGEQHLALHHEVGGHFFAGRLGRAGRVLAGHRRHRRSGSRGVVFIVAVFIIIIIIIVGRSPVGRRRRPRSFRDGAQRAQVGMFAQNHRTVEHIALSGQLRLGQFNVDLLPAVGQDPASVARHGPLGHRHRPQESDFFTAAMGVGPEHDRRVCDQIDDVGLRTQTVEQRGRWHCGSGRRRAGRGRAVLGSRFASPFGCQRDGDRQDAAEKNQHGLISHKSPSCAWVSEPFQPADSASSYESLSLTASSLLRNSISA